MGTAQLSPINTEQALGGVEVTSRFTSFTLAGCLRRVPACKRRRITVGRQVPTGPRPGGPRELLREPVPHPPRLALTAQHQGDARLPAPGWGARASPLPSWSAGSQVCGEDPPQRVIPVTPGDRCGAGWRGENCGHSICAHRQLRGVLPCARGAAGFARWLVPSGILVELDGGCAGFSVSPRSSSW